MQGANEREQIKLKCTWEIYFAHIKCATLYLCVDLVYTVPA